MCECECTHSISVFVVRQQFQIVCYYWIQQLGSIALNIAIAMQTETTIKRCALIIITQLKRFISHFRRRNFIVFFFFFRCFSSFCFLLRHRAQFYCDENRKRTWLFGKWQQQNQPNKIHQVWLVNHFISMQNSSSEKIICVRIHIAIVRIHLRYLTWSYVIITCCAWTILCSIFIGLMRSNGYE